MKDVVIKVENLSKKYIIGGAKKHSTLRDKIDDFLHHPFRSRVKNRKKDFWALKNISFNVNRGDVVGIIGKNGSGKSTLLKILSRIVEPTEGQAILKGRVASLLEVGTGFNLELTGRENVFLNGSILGMTQKEVAKKFDEIVAFSGVKKFIDTPVKRYSSGMYVRLAFAVAAHLDSDILLVDEVLAVGDAEFQKKCLGKMNSLAKSGRTLLFVSHNMNAIKSLCTKSILLSDGRIVDFDASDKIIGKYLTSPAKKLTSGKQDLKAIPRLIGNQKAIQYAWLEDDHNTIVSSAIMGKPINICFAYKANKVIKDPSYGCSIYTNYGQRVCSLTSYLISNKIYKNSSQAIVRFCIPKLTLNPGQYIISFGLSEGKSNPLDYIESALKFSVIENDVFDSGIMMTSGHGLIYMKVDIQVSSSN